MLSDGVAGHWTDCSRPTACIEAYRWCRGGYSGYAPDDGFLFIGKCHRTNGAVTIP